MATLAKIDLKLTKIATLYFLYQTMQTDQDKKQALLEAEQEKLRGEEESSIFLGQRQTYCESLYRLATYICTVLLGEKYIVQTKRGLGEGESAIQKKEIFNETCLV